MLLLAWAGLLLSAWPLDRVVENLVPRLPPKSLLRAIDTAVHGFIGGFSYWMACIICPQLVLNISSWLSQLGFGLANNKNRASQEILWLDVFYSFCVAFVISCSIDLDHIIKDLFLVITGQSPAQWERGWLHFSLPPLVLSCTLYLSALLFHSLWCIPCATLCILSIISHHIRDGVHHGLQFYPLGNTPKIPYWLYIVLTLVLPVITSKFSSSIILQVKSAVALPVRNSLEIV